MVDALDSGSVDDEARKWSRAVTDIQTYSIVMMRSSELVSGGVVNKRTLTDSGGISSSSYIIYAIRKNYY